MNFDEINVLALEEAFYSKKFHFSYSSLSKLLYSPKLFYSQYVLNQREEKLGAHLIEGKVIHCLLLEPEKFNEKFMVSPLSLPSENSKAVIDKVFQHAKQNMLLDSELKSLDSVIIDILKEANLHQSLKTDEQRVDKIVTDQTISYYSFLKEKEGKDVIDTETYTKCKESVEVLKQNPDVEISLGLGLNSAAVDIYREHPLTIDKLIFEDFGLKGIVDGVIVNHEDKTITISDLKTSGKTIADFPESVEYYNYWLQAAIYKMLVIDAFYIDGYKIIFNFIVIDIYKQSYVFTVSDATMDLWTEKAKLTLVQANHHYSKRDYTLPYKFATGKVTL